MTIGEERGEQVGGGSERSKWLDLTVRSSDVERINLLFRRTDPIRPLSPRPIDSTVEATRKTGVKLKRDQHEKG
jgi:hypothetical protein